MILVTQGSESSQGLSHFLRSFLLLSHHQQKDFKLIAYQVFLTEQLKLLNISFNLKSDSILYAGAKLDCIFLDKEMNHTMDSLNRAVSIATKNDIVLTLPARKMDFVTNHKVLSGHTEFFRNYFNTNSIAMTFVSPKIKCVLLTDHVAIKDISKSLNAESSIVKIEGTINFLNQFFPVEISNVIFSGVNPHCGEGGLLGNEEKIFETIIPAISKKFPHITMLGPKSADSILVNYSNSSSQNLYIFSSHDQGLGIFKTYNGIIGANISVGLPFIRVSPDYGTNEGNDSKRANIINGMNYVLSTCLKIRKGLHQAPS